jgi:mono/diheme cytochrome c family protein
VPDDLAEQLVEALRCGSCHARDGSADTWSEVLGESEAQPSIDELARVLQKSGWNDDQRRPPLTWTGEKLDLDWMKKFIGGEIDRKPRPGLLARMPAFRAYAGALAEGLAREHGLGVEEERMPAPDAAAVAAGRELAAAGGGFSCTTCHGAGAEPASGGAPLETINLDLVAVRLRRDFFRRFMINPQRLDPGTKMPSFAGDDGRTSVKTYYEGDATKQYDAIWQYLNSLKLSRP